MAMNALTADRFAERQAARDARRAGRRTQDLPATPISPTPTTTAATTTNALNTPQAQAFQAFYDTPVYQFPLQQGLDAINASYAGRGALQSGAAMKGIADYTAGVVAPGAFRDYMSYLGNQQAIGANAAAGQTGISSNFANSIQGASSNYANALSGLSSNYANNVTGLNANLANAQSQAAQNAGSIYGNQAIANANNTNAMIGGIGSALGGIAGNLSYQPYASGSSSMPTSGWGTPGIY